MNKLILGKLIFGSKLAEFWFRYAPCWLYNLFPAKAYNETAEMEGELRKYVEGCVRATRNDRSPQAECLIKAATDNILTYISELYKLVDNRE